MFHQLFSRVFAGVGFGVSVVAGLAVPVAAASPCDGDLRDLVVQQNFPAAYVCALAQVQAAPDATGALLVVARAAQELGQPEVALEYVARAQALPLERGEKFAGFLIAGMANAALGRFWDAGLALRRAAGYQSGVTERQILAQAFSTVSAASPWRLSGGVSIAPSTNINGGSLRDSIVWSGLTLPLNADARAQSGVGFSLDMSGQYTVRLSPALDWQTGAAVQATVYAGRGRNVVGVSGRSALSYATQAARWDGYVAFDRQLIATDLAAAVFGPYQPYSLSGTLGVERRWQPAADKQAMVYGSYTQRHYDSGAAGVRVVRAGATYRVAAGDGVFDLSGYLEDADSRDPAQAARAASLSLGYATRLAGPDVDVSASVSWTGTGYKSVLTGYGAARRDSRIVADVSVGVRAWEWSGFTPRFGLRTTRNVSNLGRYDTVDVRVYTEIRSAF